MGKVSKRQRKFLSKKILPHKKKTGKRGVVEKKKSKDSTGGDRSQQQQQQPRTAKTLPDGLDTTAFLQCPWLVSSAKDERDTCAAAFVVAPELLQIQGTARSTCTTTSRKKKRKSTCDDSDNNSNSGTNVARLTEQAVRDMIGAAVHQASKDDLLRLVWSLQTPQQQQQQQQASPPNSVPTTWPVLAPESLAHSVLLSAEGLGRLHIAFRLHLGPKREEGSTPEEWDEAALVHRQLLGKSEAWPVLRAPLLTFLAAALRTLEDQAMVVMGGGGDGKAERSRGALEEGLRLLQPRVPLLFPFPRLARQHLVFLLGLLETSDNPAVISLAFVRLYELATSQPMPFLHDAFKGVYRSYRAAADRVGALAHGRRECEGGSWGEGTVDVLPLLRECIAELFGVEKPSAYLHAYVFIHDLVQEAVAAADEVRAGGGKTREPGQALRRLRSWGFLQSLQV
ncbi:unnamed protein product, partial [Sphacelaria rigidula]